MRFRLTLTFLASALLYAPLCAQTTLDTGFKDPPNSAKPHTWWHWINGNISKAGITADLEAMKRIGIGGAQIFNVEVGIPLGDTPFMSPQWQDAIAFAFKEAKRLGIEICVHNCAGWSSSGGPWVKPDHAMQAVTFSETLVHGPSHYSATLPQPPTKLGSYHDIAVYAVKTSSASSYRIPNIRQKAAYERGDRMAPETMPAPPGAAVTRDNVRALTLGSDGKVDWDVPDGDWTIIRFGHTPTGAVNAPSPVAGRGPEVDKLSREAMDDFWSGMMASVLKDNGPVETYGLNNALIDSYEVGSQNWTPKFQQEFQRRRGYDPLPYLPVFTGRVVESREISERFLWDVRRTVCDLFADNYFGYFKELCHKNGLKFSTEGYGNGSFDNLQVSGMADIPMGEFWVGGGAIETTKLAASAGHTNGKPVIGAESFTADDNRGRWLVDPYSIKALGDRIFTLGINRYIFHRYAHQPWTNLEPGMTMGPWGMNLERTVTWWNQGDAWMKYIARCQYLLQSGRFVADVVAFTGEEGPNDLPMLRGQVVPDGYDYDGCDLTVLKQMRVDNGTIVLPTGMEYKVLLLPESKWMTPSTLQVVANLIKAGATVVGSKPERSPSLGDLGAGDAKVKALADQVWGMTGKDGAVVKYGKGMVVWGTNLGLKKEKSDFSATKPLNWIHRLIMGADVYFVANPAYRNVDVDATFRVSGRQPELWNAETGVIQPASVWSEKSGRTTVSLKLEPAGSVFVVFRRPATKSHLVSLGKVGENGVAVKPPKIQVVEARYEAPDGAGGADVTAKVADMVARGETEIAATNSNFGDPAYNHVKVLKVVFTVDGKKLEKTVGENETLELFGTMPEDTPPDFSLQGNVLQAWKTVSLEAKSSSGKKWRIDAKAPDSMTVSGPWTLTFPPNRGAPASVKVDKLMSWPEFTDPGVRYFSGSGTYETSFEAPSAMFGKGKSVWLDLGRVKNFAEVWVNGHKLPTLWKAPFRLNVSGFAHSGKNLLVVRVTNLWPNRLIGDEQYPDEVKWNGASIASWPQWLVDGKPRPETKRIAFTTWRLYGKDSPLLESGLIGPVKVVSVRGIDVLGGN